MARVTNNRTFVDVGDDDRSVLLTRMLTQHARSGLFNNVDYYYRLLAL
jgi:hypothetical protein